MTAKYGLSFEEISQIHVPVTIYAEWGSSRICVQRPEYTMVRIDLQAGHAQPLHYYLRREGAYYVEAGEVILRYRNRQGAMAGIHLHRGGVFNLDCGLAHGLAALADSTVYFFANWTPEEDNFTVEMQEEADSAFVSIVKGPLAVETRTTSDYRDKYWGSIETILNGDVAGKRIVLRAGSQSSLEFHCHKVETYYLQSGCVKVGLRVGRGENKSIIMNAGESFDVTPGLMHMRMALEDSIIVEVSTRDADRDSYLVEDGMRYVHKED